MQFLRYRHTDTGPYTLLLGYLVVKLLSVTFLNFFSRYFFSFIFSSYQQRLKIIIIGRYGLLFFKHSRVEDGRYVFTRALKNLETRDAADVSAKFAQLEFKYGDQERGMFFNKFGDVRHGGWAANCYLISGYIPLRFSFLSKAHRKINMRHIHNNN